MDGLFIVLFISDWEDLQYIVNGIQFKLSGQLAIYFSIGHLLLQIFHAKKSPVLFSPHQSSQHQWRNGMLIHDAKHANIKHCKQQTAIYGANTWDTSAHTASGLK